MDRTILSDNGRELCRRPDHHSHELSLQLKRFEHRTSRVRRPLSNGFIEGKTPIMMFLEGLEKRPTLKPHKTTPTRGRCQLNTVSVQAWLYGMMLRLQSITVLHSAPSTAHGFPPQPLGTSSPNAAHSGTAPQHQQHAIHIICG